MIKLEDFDSCPKSGYTYGGAAGSKLGIVLDNENWFLKYPKSTKSLENVLLSYSTAPLSEYLASHIYESVGIETHKTKLGFSDGKIVVACKDFLKPNETLYDYNAIRNSYNRTIERENSNFSSSLGECPLEEIALMAKENIYFQKIANLYDHFWDMFVIDALIDNHDRNAGNWGIIFNKETGETEISPVYDNGASFYNKNDDNKMKDILGDEIKFKQVAYDSARTVFKLADKSINPLKYIESLKNENCNNALLRVVPKIDLKKICTILDEIPNEFDGLKVMSDIQKEFYLRVLKYRYEKVLLPTYNKLK